MIKDILIYNKMETRTLAIDKELYEEAQRFANSKGADLTKLVEAYLKSLLKEEGVEGYENIEIPTFYIDEKSQFIKTSPCSIPRSKGTLCCYCLKFLIMFLESILMSQMSIRKIVFVSSSYL